MFYSSWLPFRLFYYYYYFFLITYFSRASPIILFLSLIYSHVCTFHLLIYYHSADAIHPSHVNYVNASEQFVFINYKNKKKKKKVFNRTSRVKIKINLHYSRGIISNREENQVLVIFDFFFFFIANYARTCVVYLSCFIYI